MAKKGSQLTVRTATEIQGGEFVILGYAGRSYQMTLDELKKFIGIIEADGGSVDLTQVSTDILPLADASKDIGSLEKRWKKVYSTALTVKAQGVDEEEVNIHDGGIEGKIGQDIQWSIDGSGKANFYELTVNGADVATMQYVNNELSKILGGASGAYDTLKEIEDILKNDTTGLAALLEEIGTKADKSTVVAINSRVTDLEDADFVDIDEFRDTLDPLAASLQGGIDSLWSRDSFDALYAGHLMADSVAAERVYVDEVDAVDGNFDSLSVDGKAVIHAGNITSQSVQSAETAGTAASAGYAYRAGQATNDSAGNKIVDTYLKIEDYSADTENLATKDYVNTQGFLKDGNIRNLVIKNSGGTELIAYRPTSSGSELTLQASHVGLGNVRNVASFSQDEVIGLLKGYLPVAGGQITGDLNISGDLTMNGSFYVGNSESDFASIDEDGNGVFKSLKVGNSNVALASDLSGYLPLSGGTIHPNSTERKVLTLDTNSSYGAILTLSANGSATSEYGCIPTETYGTWIGCKLSNTALVIGGDGGLYVSKDLSDLTRTHTIIHTGNIGTYVDNFLTSLQGGIDSLWSRDSFDALYAGHLMADSVAAERVYVDEVDAVDGNFDSLSVDGKAVIHAGNITSQSVQSAETAGTAASAGYAYRAGQATNDSAGNKIVDTYLKIEDYSADTENLATKDYVNTQGFLKDGNIRNLVIKNSGGTELIAYRPTSSGSELTLQASHVGLGNVRNVASFSQDEVIGLLKGYLPVAGGQITGDLNISGDLTMNGSFYVGNSESDFASIDEDGNGVFKSLKVGNSNVALASDLSGYLPLSGGTIHPNSTERKVLTLDTNSSYGAILTLSANGSATSEYGCIPTETYGTWIGCKLSNTALVIGGDGGLYVSKDLSDLTRTHTIIHTGNIGTYVDNFLTSLQGGIDSLWSRDSFDELYAGHLMADSIAAERVYVDEIEASTAIMGSNKTLSLFPSKQTSEAILPIKIAKIGSQHTLYCDEAAAYDLGTSTYRFAKVYCTEVYQSSDASLKDILGDIPLTVEQIANAPAVLFKWKSGIDEAAHVGTIAQYWKGILPEVVSGEEGSMGIEEATLGVANSIVLARAIARYEKRMAILESEIYELRNR